MYTYNFATQQKLTQHCKATLLQQKLIKNNKQTKTFFFLIHQLTAHCPRVTLMDGNSFYLH